MTAAPTENAPRVPGAVGNKRILKAIILGPVKKEELTTGATKELPPDDMLESLTNDGKLLMPPFDKLVLAMLMETSTSLGQLVAAMAQNIDGFGHRFESRIAHDAADVPKDIMAGVAEEKAKLTNFFNNATQDYSFTELRKRTRTDIEMTGEGFWEVIRLPSTREIVGFNHIPSYQVNLGCQDKDLTKYERQVPMLQPDGSVKLEKLVQIKRFRRFIQSRISVYTRGLGFGRGAYQLRWFKEWGDPRVINNETGDVVPDDQLDKVPEEKRANELIHWRIYSPRTPYGLPRYIGNLITLFGDRAADEVNYITLRNNNIPSMVILVSNGQLTEGSIERIGQFIESQIHGSDNYSKFLLIEGEGNMEGDEASAMKMDLKPLTSEQMRDQLFQEYGKNNREKLRETFRLPPIFVGRAEDYTRATAEASRKLADEQVFSPERDEFDNFMNLQILPSMGILYHSYVSNGPNVTDDTDLIAILDSAERAGGMTPRLARRIIADILSIDEGALPVLDPSIKPDVPFSIQIAEAVKNEAEPQHQLAVKSDPTYNLVRQLRDLRDEVERHVQSYTNERRAVRQQLQAQLGTR